MAGIDKKIFKILSNHKKIQPKFANEHSIRQTISNIKRDNPGLTSNGATQCFAKKYGVSVFKYIDNEDKQSISRFYKPKTSPVHYPHKISAKSQKSRKKSKLLPFDQKLVNEATANSEIYPYVYILENNLRKLILDKFTKIPNWWTNNKIVKQDIQDYAKRIQNAEKTT